MYSFARLITMITLEDFKRLDLRVGTVTGVSEHPNADSLILLETDIGEENPRQLVAGIKKHYDSEELEGTQIIVLTNLEEATIRGEKSEGMVLAATTGEDVVLITPDKDVPAGSEIQ